MKKRHFFIGAFFKFGKPQDLQNQKKPSYDFHTDEIFYKTGAYLKESPLLIRRRIECPNRKNNRSTLERGIVKKHLGEDSLLP
jgi:hypothetical protein